MILRATLLSSLLVLTACGGTTNNPVPAGTLSQTSTDWYLRYGAGTPDHPTVVAGAAWALPFPQMPGSVHYVTTPYRPAHSIAGGTLSLTFRVVSNDPNYSLADPKTYGTPALHLFIERAHDDFTNPSYRWWCAGGSYALGTADNQVITVSCPLTPEAWTQVEGRTDPQQFQATLDDLEWVGFTLGASAGWGHGVGLASGSAQFELLSATLRGQ